MCLLNTFMIIFAVRKLDLIYSVNYGNNDVQPTDSFQR